MVAVMGMDMAVAITKRSRGATVHSGSVITTW